MYRFVLVLGLLAGCDSAAEQSCPDQPPWRGGSVDCNAVGDTCAYDNWMCTCDSSGKFYCSNCPTTACTPGTACSYSNWEHDCECTCGSDGSLACSGSNCGST